MGKALRIEALKMEDGDMLIFEMKNLKGDDYEVLINDDGGSLVRPDQPIRKSFVIPLFELVAKTREENMEAVIRMSRAACLELGHSGVAKIFVRTDEMIGDDHVLQLGFLFQPDIPDLITNRYNPNHEPWKNPFPVTAVVGSDEDEDAMSKRYVVPEIMGV